MISILVANASVLADLSITFQSLYYLIVLKLKFWTLICPKIFLTADGIDETLSVSLFCIVCILGFYHIMSQAYLMKGIP